MNNNCSSCKWQKSSFGLETVQKEAVEVEVMVVCMYMTKAQPEGMESKMRRVDGGKEVGNQ
jgi:hypothetical protein